MEYHGFCHLKSPRYSVKFFFNHHKIISLFISFLKLSDNAFIILFILLQGKFIINLTIFS
ncbi:hypothetical protein CHAB381_0343 [Campylobacter hominis ATCC BAA-381]|uniref:Uncharacterized protein n=1 Tax=Campylobacter hominis (strain ATCC BAA-381 / DSM 21671 / CCUG 45161 / LMG 19568 / NCTC 13146 / CH001A) TaxID=360107 RepID=A7I0A4_CAMHC|nr:hypothetical protein CHAB381_0343 [Campylobacter hominis ATCC BAA-381]